MSSDGPDRPDLDPTAWPSNTQAVPSDPWPIRHPVCYSVICTVAIVGICAPPAIRTYRRSVTS
jgi:hypothetical protein